MAAATYKQTASAAQMTNGLHTMEDKLVDLRAMIRLGLTLTEHVDQQTLGKLLGELNTLFYLLQDKVDACATTNAAMFRADYAAADARAMQ
ncbi:hypothetical protein RvVAR0630_18270 [Agrobacterium vitis]|uniref:hypothetical protein n=1 Tax=Agrobacterium vitis TaxID=373 RepID=UPI0015D6A8B3|nr:hypothetical protein [Agrobacterium vitis]BCH59203.1 hypothetical protein RvVAR0630_18270 [Agrobacterium vitis]